MTTLTCNAPSVSDPHSNPSTSGLAIRVVQPNADDQIVSLPSGKCTVGSSERCHVHLTCGQVRPLHCLIVHDGAETTVTRWAAGAELNGQDFATAPFQPGDCLQIGAVQLWLIAAFAPLPDPAKPPLPLDRPAAVERTVGQNDERPQSIPAGGTIAAPSAAPPSETKGSRTSTAASQLEADRLVSRLWTANYGSRQRCRKLVRALRRTRTKASDFDLQISNLQQQLREAFEEREQIFTQLSQLQSAADQRESQSSQELDRLISELTVAYEKASLAETAVVEQSQHTARLEAELASLQGQREQWDQIRAAGDLQRSKLAQALADREQSVQCLQVEIAQVRAAANKADASRGEQALAMEALQTELELVCAEREQLIAAQTQSQQYQQDVEQALCDSEQNLAVFQLELEKFQFTSRQTEQELRESIAGFATLQVEFAQLSQERDQLATKRTEYQLREQGWEHELSSRDRQIEELSEEIEQLRGTVAASNQDAAAQLSLLEDLQQQVGVLTSERDQLLVAQAEQVDKNQEWAETVAAGDRRIKELEEEHEGICQVLQSVEKGAFEQVDTCNRLENQLAKLRAERDQLATVLPEQQEYTRRLEQSLAERDGQIVLLSDELTQTTARQLELETELAQSTTASQARQAELAELSRRCEQLVAAQSSSDHGRSVVQQTLVEYQEQVEELQQQIAASLAERQELEQEIAGGSRSNEAFQAALNALEAKHEQLTTEYQAETLRRQQLDEQLALQQQDTRLFEVDLKSAQAELGRAVEQVSTLQSEREILNLQLSGLRDELAAQAKVGDQADSELQQQRDELVSELVSVRQELDEVRQRAGAARSDAAAAADLAAKLAEEKSLLQQDLEQRDQQTQQLADELQEVRSELATGQGDLKQLRQLHQQSERDSQQAQLCLPVAEQALRERESVQETVLEPVSEETTEMSAARLAAGWDDAVAAEPWQESPMLDDSDATVAAVAADNADSPPTVELAGDDLVLHSAAEPAAPAEEFQPPSFIDQYQHLLEDHEEAGSEPAQPEPIAAPAVNKLAAQIDAAETLSDEDSDEAALEAYMSNMMRRMRGDESSDNSQPPPASNVAALNQHHHPVTAVDSVLQRVASASEGATETQHQGLLDMEELKLSSRKPALPTDLAAMRELANSSARRAIAKHHKRLHLEKALGLFFVCLIFICIGAYMLLTAAAVHEFLGLKFAGGAVAVLTGLVGGFKLLGQLVLAIREGAWEKRAPAQVTAVESQFSSGGVAESVRVDG